METLTATELKLGIVYFVFHDGELSQIAQAQKLPYNRKACSVLPDIQIRGVAEATGAAFLSMQTNDDVGAVICEEGLVDEEFVRTRNVPCVIKAAGLAKGKGVTICYRTEDAIETIDWYFRFRGRLIHKVCHFYLMETEQTETSPQREEGITACRWSPFAEAHEVISYANAREVLRRAHEMVTASLAPR